MVRFAVAFGVLLDTIVVRSVLVTALNLDLGRWMWWPGKLSREPARREPEPARREHSGHGSQPGSRIASAGRIGGQRAGSLRS